MKSSKQKIKLIIVAISLILAVVGCSNDGSHNVGPEEANLNVTISTPQVNNETEASIESVIDEIEVDLIKITLENTEDSEEIYQEQKDVEDDTVAFEFNNLEVEENYHVEVDAFEEDNDREVLVYQGNSEVAIDEQDSTVDINLELVDAKGLIVELNKDDFDDVEVNEINLLPESNNLSASINGLRAEFEQLRSNYYSLAVDLDNDEELDNEAIYIYGDEITLAELSYSESEGLSIETSWEDEKEIADFNITTDKQEYDIEEEVELEVKNESEQELEFPDSALGLEAERRVDGSWQEYDLDLTANDEIVSLAAGESETINLDQDNLGEAGVYRFEVVTHEEDSEDQIIRDTEIEIVEEDDFDGVEIYYSSDSTPEIWVWEDDGDDITEEMGYDWDEQPVMEETENDGWYLFEIPDEYLTGEPLEFHFEGDNSEVIERGSNASGWYDGSEWYDENPDGPSKPVIDVSPGEGSYQGTREISVEISNADESSIQFAGEEVANDFILDEYLEEEETATLEVSASNEEGTNEKELDYTKEKEREAIVPEDRIEEFHNLRIYQVMTSSFQSGDDNLGYGTGYGPSDHMGDLVGIKEAIPYIADLGMNAIWMTPVFDTYGDDQLASTGYFTNDFFSIDPEFGTEEDMKNLIDKADKYDLYVFFDGVFGHHNDSGEIPSSPSGYDVAGGNDPVDYPGSLNFFEEVATYWIEEYGIDGWRLDQAYQVTDYQGKQDRNYWPDIREAVEEAAEETDTLGYMVGEIWDGEDVIQDYGYETESGDVALYSNYEFPLRYRLVQTLATQEHTDQDDAYDRSAEALDEGYEAYEETYSEHAIPNLMLTNHDLVRFGTLIERAPHLGYGKDNPDYWSRHEAAISFLAAHTGPITLYYGDEIGDDIPGYVDERDSGYWDDHASRTDGQIDGFDSDQQNLRDYVQELMELRDNNPALWRGERVNLIAEDNQYADLKVDEDSGEEMLYLLNIGTDGENFAIDSSDLGGENLTDALTGDEIDTSGSEIEIAVDGLSARFIEIN